MLGEHGGSVTELFAEIPNYPQKRFEIPCPDEFKKKTMKKIKEVLLNEEDFRSIWTYDGIRINYHDGSWLLIRASGTVPYIRVYLEAKNQKKLKLIVNKTKRILKESINKSYS